MDALASVHTLLEKAKLDYALIGAYAVNAWLEPRFTADIDVVAVAPAERLAEARTVLEEQGYKAEFVDGSGSTGPDFLRFTAEGEDALLLEIQIAKTEFQLEVVRRAAVGDSGVRISTPEDLIIMKLIAYRPKDRIDLEGLIRLPDLDWPYIEKWAGEWDVLERLHIVRDANS